MSIFWIIFRISPTRYEELLVLIAPLDEIKSSNETKSNQQIESIGRTEWLCVTLRYLVTRDSQISLISFCMSSACFGRTIKNTSEILWDVLT